MRVRFWGVRGSTPAPLSRTDLRHRLRAALVGAAGLNLSDPAVVETYLTHLPAAVGDLIGGHTTCLSVEAGDELIILDAGSGMRALGQALMQRPDFAAGRGIAHILLTHGHWDHLQGYPFFAPAYIPGNQLFFYAVNADPTLYLRHQMTAPTYFPVAFDEQAATVHGRALREDATLQIGDVRITSLSLYHPGTAYAFRIEHSGKALVFASDAEYRSLAEAGLRRYLAFYAGADVLVFDAQYGLRETFLQRADWGHSSAIIGVDLAERAGIRRLVLVHHDPNAADADILEAAAAAREYALVNDLCPNTDVLVGREGLELQL
jgi:phosphoribosyl 1,2-cyclic phosphodiesterase